MTSSTDVLSNDGFQGPDGDSPQKHYKNQSGSQSSSHELTGITEEVQEEIEAMIESIPQVDEVFTIINKIGSGTFSSVYVAKLKKHPEIEQMFALKHIIPTSHPSRIESELRCLYEIGGDCHVMGVKACFREKDHVVIVMPHFPHDKFQDYVQGLSVVEVREYMQALLLSLKQVHEQDIIHRDVKPSNFLFNRQQKKYALVDFGLAQKAPVPLQDDNPSTSTDTPSAATCRNSENLKKTRSHSADAQIPISPQKRKYRSDDIENQPESPRKRRQLSESGVGVGLSLVDTNQQEGTVKHKSENTPAAKVEETKVPPDGAEQTSNINMTPPTPGLLKPAYMKAIKSPRRLLLTKRTLDKQRCTLFEQGGSSATKARNEGARKGSVVVMEKGGKQMYKMVAPTSCQCFGKPMICSICMARSGQHAPRAGTPGFRAPEVLMKCPEQTTAVDVWSAGVIFLSLLSGRYPFFKAPDDLTALAQIISVVGSEEMKAGALSFGKDLQCNPKTPAVDIPVMCCELRKIASQRHLENNKRDADKSTTSDWANVPAAAYSLLKGLLDVNPNTRLTAGQALKHEFFRDEAQHL